VRMSKNDRDMLEYVCKRSGLSRSDAIRGMIRLSYSKAYRKRKRQLGEPF
jgi:hypothetical protein